MLFEWHKAKNKKFYDWSDSSTVIINYENPRSHQNGHPLAEVSRRRPPLHHRRDTSARAMRLGLWICFRGRKSADGANPDARLGPPRRHS